MNVSHLFSSFLPLYYMDLDKVPVIEGLLPLGGVVVESLKVRNEVMRRYPPVKTFIGFCHTLSSSLLMLHFESTKN